eukprot:gene26130-31551_t
MTHALSLSGLLPPFFKPQYGTNKIPRRALVFVTLLQIIIYFLLKYVDEVSVTLLLVVTIMGACGSYMGVFWAYLTFQTRFPTMDRGLAIPYGKAVAYVGITIFAFLFVTAVGFQPNSYIAVLFYVVYLSTCMVYYYRVAEKRQFFSAEEQKKFMKAYILNANKMKKRHQQRAKENVLFRYMQQLYALLPTFVLDFINSSRHGVGNITLHSTSNNASPAKTANTPKTATQSPNLIGNNKVSPAFFKDDDCVRAGTKVSTNREEDEIERVDPMIIPIPQQPLPTSLSMAPSMISVLTGMPSHNANIAPSLSPSANLLVLAWSGRVMNPRQSREFFAFLSGGEDSSNVNATLGGAGHLPTKIDSEEEQSLNDEAKVYQMLRQSMPEFFTIENDTNRDCDVPV